MTRRRLRGARTEPFFDSDLAATLIVLVPFLALIGLAIAL